jgi:hypothetical protein
MIEMEVIAVEVVALDVVVVDVVVVDVVVVDVVVVDVVVVDVVEVFATEVLARELVAAEVIALDVVALEVFALEVFAPPPGTEEDTLEVCVAEPVEELRPEAAEPLLPSRVELLETTDRVDVAAVLPEGPPSSSTSPDQSPIPSTVEHATPDNAEVNAIVMSATAAGLLSIEAILEFSTEQEHGGLVPDGWNELDRTCRRRWLWRGEEYQEPRCQQRPPGNKSPRRECRHRGCHVLVMNTG